MRAMVVYCGKIAKRTSGELDFVDITREVSSIVAESKVRNGVATIYVPGATAAIVVNESEQNILEDFREAIQRMAPETGSYRHGDNARSHIRAMILGPSESLPVTEGQLDIGTWQSIFLVELDVRPRRRQVLVRVVGSSTVHRY